MRADPREVLAACFSATPSRAPAATITNARLHLLALRHDLQAPVELPPVPQKTEHDVSNQSMLRVLGERSLPSVALHLTLNHSRTFFVNFDTG